MSLSFMLLHSNQTHIFPAMNFMHCHVVPVVSFKEWIIHVFDDSFIRTRGVVKPHCSLAIFGRILLSTMDRLEYTWGHLVGAHSGPIKESKRRAARSGWQDPLLQLKFYLSRISVPVLSCLGVLQCDEKSPRCIERTV